MLSEQAVWKVSDLGGRQQRCKGFLFQAAAGERVLTEVSRRDPAPVLSAALSLSSDLIGGC